MPKWICPRTRKTNTTFRTQRRHTLHHFRASSAKHKNKKTFLNAPAFRSDFALFRRKAVILF